ncbi:methylthioribose-1-phosphate isomerase [Schizosaccharomyces japonicus yFS275]|uniref:Methylthioribose-1-phosphate isomerase n=1 Tax=Schizosaccharomyces japonicus (strain yFS275 / FY16936) TaxID=402676 RepID=MTNA_SCHJY|nr:methylthioribose-1-phosphate isomerase [Schizosaccharomyces japonicus yFS275]B6K4Q2.1 RecName: Full=Methylthioribose-1-phosphate isomerase; Short=M1Pi; Short=MTR-1-P isomerase; AltName: Full=S-methyl-5-thioribose-1-phosphate isomerase; AltName: Full=Translation initiation factor eIF-2B subunit alpha/beta/delta-like protein [Schizosaccharomyces japonicus yFS275]EEB08459.1 methylthioribose-1-phosphate isomerase [Schizosaccharomyces japonicus yFS275]
MSLQAIVYEDNKLSVLDQLLLPHEHKYIPIKSVEDAYSVIKNMQVRGAPAIAIVAALAVAVSLVNVKTDDLRNYVIESFERLKQSRPTAVNLFQIAYKMRKLAEAYEGEEIRVVVVKEAEDLLARDLRDNHTIGELGSEYVLKLVNKPRLTILTHCNTGSLATSGYGTALGIIRSLNEKGAIERVYCTETRPNNQGSRLTAYELLYDNIASTLITDSTAASIMPKIDAVIVGCDRVARNGDTANKIGTLSLAILAKHFNVPFIVAGPSFSIDMTLPDGEQTKIEERPSRELVMVRGPVVRDFTTHQFGARESVHIAPINVKAYCPVFDVTPADLISAVVTEKAVFTKGPNGYEFKW